MLGAAANPGKIRKFALSEQLRLAFAARRAPDVHLLDDVPALVKQGDEQHAGAICIGELLQAAREALVGCRERDGLKVDRDLRAGEIKPVPSR